MFAMCEVLDFDADTLVRQHGYQSVNPIVAGNRLVPLLRANDWSQGIYGYQWLAQKGDVKKSLTFTTEKPTVEEFAQEAKAELT